VIASRAGTNQAAPGSLGKIFKESR
jgi:hypothetical protein